MHYDTTKPITPTNYPKGFRFPPKVKSYKGPSETKTKPKELVTTEEDRESPLVVTSLFDFFS